MNDILFLKKEKVLANRTIYIEIKGRILKSIDTLTKYFEGERLAETCKKGCPNYGMKWSCPPFAVPFSNLAKRYTYAFLLIFSTEMKYYEDIKNKYLAVKAANVTLKSTIEKSTRDLEIVTKGYTLLSGSCRLCKPCYCKMGKPCKHPDRMRYSMEATGLNVQRLSLDFLEHELLWYKDKTLPRYTSAVTLVLYNEDFTIENMARLLEESMKR